MNNSIQRIIDWLFRDKHGKMVIVQKPNAPAVIAFVAFAVRALTHDKISHAADLVFFGTAFVWAWLELTQGVNGFRRILGGLVLLGLLINRW